MSSEIENVEFVIPKPKKRSETKDIVIAWLGISICFALVLGEYHLFRIKNLVNFNIYTFIMFLVISLIITGTAFILHELAHKYSAIYYGAKARFIKWNRSLVFSIIFAFITGFVFVAPGAVYVFGKRLSTKENGVVSVAGPVTNILLGFIFIILFYLIAPKSLWMVTLLKLGVLINFWIAFFNLLPIGPLDGKAIIKWNPVVWVLLIAISLGGWFFF